MELFPQKPKIVDIRDHSIIIDEAVRIYLIIYLQNTQKNV